MKEADVQRSPLPCGVLGCEDKRLTRGWCNKHYKRWREHGSPEVVLVAPKGTGWITPGGYMRRGISGKKKLEHRTIWEEAYGPTPKGYVIHHINGDRLDNRLENLDIMLRGEHTKLHNPKHTGCSVPGCDRPYWSRGHCHAHYQQMRRRGEIRPIRQYKRKSNDD